MKNTVGIEESQSISCPLRFIFRGDCSDSHCDLRFVSLVLLSISHEHACQFAWPASACQHRWLLSLLWWRRVCAEGTWTTDERSAWDFTH